MTIREHFKLVANRLKYGLVALAIALILAITWRYPSLTKQQGILAAMAVGAVIGLMISVIYRLFFRCPRCHVYLNMKGQIPIRPYDVPGTFWDRWDRCPKCQVSLDEPWKKSDGTGK